MTSINLNPNGPPETILLGEPPEAIARLSVAMALPIEQRRSAVAEVLTGFPTFLDGWARLGELGRDQIESYAAFRVGYHRGLDALRQSGWRGSGYVRWEHEANRGFLRALDGLQRTSALIGEADEADRCAHFLQQLDPNWSGISQE